MTQRTCNIILACKGSLYPEIDSRIERVKAYMSDVCACPKEWYTDKEVESIMVNAVYDYIDTCDKPSTFLRLMYDCIAKDVSLTQRICIAFTLVKVKNDDEYVNGFKEVFFKSTGENLNDG